MIAHAPWLLLVLLALGSGFRWGRRSATLGGDVDTVTARQSPAPSPQPSVPERRCDGHVIGNGTAKLPSSPSRSRQQRPSLAAAKSWGYQLQDIEVGKAAASPADVLVLDHARDGTEDTVLEPRDLERLKHKPDGTRRIVLACCSIGEAESYRFYWQKQWTRQQPGWLLGENPDGDENHAVRFWDPGWQRIIFGGPDAYVDRILAQGFDGLYLDTCDVSEDIREHFPKVARERPSLERDMVDFVSALATHARNSRPESLVVMQNAEPLLEQAALRRIIDGVAKEELLFGLDRTEEPNDRTHVDWSRKRLDLMKSEGKPVFVVEYLDSHARILDARRQIANLGYVLYVAPKDRELACLRDPAADA